MPGFPDIYRGDEGGLLALTDPDNRLPVDWDALARRGADTNAKLHWTRQLLALRGSHRDFLRDADARVQVDGDGLRLIRAAGGTQVVAEFSPTAVLPADPLLSRVFEDGSSVCVRLNQMEN